MTDALIQENERLKAENEALKDTIQNWFDIKSLAREQLEPSFVAAVEGYLRTASSGGMPMKQVTTVKNVLEDFARLYLADAVWPHLLRIAEEKRGELKVPVSIPTRADMNDASLMKLIQGAIDEPHRAHGSLLFALNELEARIKNA